MAAPNPRASIAATSPAGTPRASIGAAAGAPAIVAAPGAATGAAAAGAQLEGTDKPPTGVAPPMTDIAAMGRAGAAGIAGMGALGAAGAGACTPGILGGAICGRGPAVPGARIGVAVTGAAPLAPAVPPEPKVVPSKPAKLLMPLWKALTSVDPDELSADGIAVLSGVANPWAAVCSLLTAA